MKDGADVSYEWMRHCVLFETGEEICMRVEQQNANIVDTLKQSIGPEERETEISFPQKAAAKVEEKAEAGQTVNLKDATYLKPGMEEKKTAADEIEENAALDATERKNQMAVLSNTTSAEDYARMQEDGFSLDATVSNTIVTEIDKIKAELAKAGVDLSFLGDDLDYEQLEAITGSAALAGQIVSAMREADLPASEDNVKDMIETVSMAGELQAPGDGAIKYLLDNQLEPTVENLYKAEFSGSNMYQAKSDETVDISSFSDQVESVIRQAGLTVSDETVSDSKWLLENEIPLTPENLQYYELLKNGSFPIDMKTLSEQIASAIAEGGRPQSALVFPEAGFAARAEQAFEIVNEATEEDLTYIIDHGMDLSLRSLEAAIANRESAAIANGQSVAREEDAALLADDTQTARDVDGTVYTRKGLELLTARRQLEEIRLAMTIQANYSLLRQGISIETEPLEQLVEQLKAEENAYYENLLKTQGIETTETNVSLFRETTEKVTELKTLPAYVLGMEEARENTVNAVHSAGTALRDRFEQANERYETLMTAPRADLGDSIQKAFGNVDDILRDLGFDLSEENRRAVRILGYNSLEITPESIAQMKDADETVQRVFHSLTPAVVLQMIKKGMNPLDMDFRDLNAAADEIADETEDGSNQKFSEFLWKLERNHEITKEERSSYIGIYRLIHQVEKTDGAVIGALVNQGAELTMRNLMMAVRSERRGGKMDYSVDDAFGERKGSTHEESSITDQIETSYQNNCLKDVADLLTPEKIRALLSEVPDWENMTPEQLKETLQQTETNERDVDYAYAREELNRLAESAHAASDIYDILQKYDIPNTMMNVIAVQTMVQDRNRAFRQIFGQVNENSDGKTRADELEKIKEELLEEFGEAVKTPKEMGEAQEKLGELAENVMKTMIESDEVTSLDVREMRLLAAQLSIGRQLAREEQYSVPVMVSDGVVNVSLKIVRGVDKKGTVDIMMESGLRGKIAATFQAKEEGITGLVATDHQDTRQLLEDSAAGLLSALGDETVSMNYVYSQEFDMNRFSSGMYGIHAEDSKAESEESESYQVQTARLYHIAESFIRTIRDVL